MSDEPKRLICRSCHCPELLLLRERRHPARRKGINVTIISRLLECEHCGLQTRTRDVVEDAAAG